jgi:hypothetical protein
MVGSGGCAGGLDIAVIGAATSAASSGAGVMSSGKIKVAGMVDAESLRTAVLIAADELDLTIASEESPGPRRFSFILKDDRNARLWVHIDQRTDAMSRVEINAGIFGSVPTAKLLLKRIGVALDPDRGDDGDRFHQDPVEGSEEFGV